MPQHPARVLLPEPLGHAFRAASLQVGKQGAIRRDMPLPVSSACSYTHWNAEARSCRYLVPRPPRGLVKGRATARTWMRDYAAAGTLRGMLRRAGDHVRHASCSPMPEMGGKPPTARRGARRREPPGEGRPKIARVVVQRVLKVTIVIRVVVRFTVKSAIFRIGASSFEIKD